MTLRTCVFVLMSATLLAQEPPPFAPPPNREVAAPNVSFDRLLQSNKEPQNWLTYSGGLSSQRHSLLNAINAIRTRIVSCNVPISSDSTVDWSLVDVSFTTTSGTCPGSPAGGNSCAIPQNATNGYTINQGTSTMTINGTWCTYLTSVVQTDSNAQVTVDLGCNCVPVPGEVDCDNVLGDTNCNGPNDNNLSTAAVPQGSPWVTLAGNNTGGSAQLVASLNAQTADPVGYGTPTRAALYGI